MYLQVKYPYEQNKSENKSVESPRDEPSIIFSGLSAVRVATLHYSGFLGTAPGQLRMSSRKESLLPLGRLGVTWVSLFGCRISDCDGLSKVRDRHILSASSVGLLLRLSQRRPVAVKELHSGRKAAQCQDKGLLTRSQALLGK